MSLSPGDRLGPYEIVAPLGAGGMGEVYRARDPRLDRTVAIKILSPDRTDDPDRQQRFEREARAVAALSHPNICAVYDVGHEGGITFLVMEYLDGETLAGRLGRSVGPGGAPQGLPVAETLAIAAQIASGLAAAHRARIVHRDLKPANVVLTKSGAKILDFGLARIAAGPQASGLASGTQTMAAPLTGVGTLLGTVPYMSPEQVEGKETDARSDIFSLGSVIYEMATGRRAFDGASQASLIAAILERQPAPITQVEPLTPPGLERIVRACIAKAPEDRWQYAGDVARQLSWLAGEIESGVLSTPSGAVPAAGKIASERRRLSWPTAILGAVTITAAALVAFVFYGRAPGRGGASDASSIHFSLSVPGVSVSAVRVSPDGRTLAIEGDRAGGSMGIWTRRLDDTRTVELPNLQATALVGWSRDGKQIAVRTARGVIAVRLDGGIVTPLAALGKGWLETWRGDGALLRGSEDGLHLITIGSGNDRVIIPGLALHPSFLPDGRRFVYTARVEPETTGNPGGIFLSSVDAPDDRRLVLPVRSKAKVALDRLLFVRDGTLFAQRIDSDTGKVSGEAAPVVDGVTFFNPAGNADFDVAANTLVYRTPSPDDTPTWFGRTGKSEGTLGAPGAYEQVRISPDGKRVVISLGDRRRGTGDLWVQDIARGNAVRLTDDEAGEGSLLWARDSRSIVYGSDRNGPPDIYALDVDGASPPRLVYASPGVDYPAGWMSDGRLLVWTSREFKVVGLDGKVDESVVGLPGSSRRNPRFSPDGRWIASTFAESGRDEVYVEPLRRPGPRVQVSVGGGSRPVWAGDGRSLFYLSGHTILEARVHPDATFESDTPAPVLTIDSEIQAYDVAPDGRRFLVLRAPPKDFLPYQVLVNWQEKGR